MGGAGGRLKPEQRLLAFEPDHLYARAGYYKGRGRKRPSCLVIKCGPDEWQAVWLDGPGTTSHRTPWDAVNAAQAEAWRKHLERTE